MKQFIHEFLPAINYAVAKHFKRIFGIDLNSILYSYYVLYILIIVVSAIIVYEVYCRYYRSDDNSNTLIAIVGTGIDDDEDVNVNKGDPMSLPSYKGEKSGPCPVCGHPIVIARQSRKTGELYFGCAAPKYGQTRG